MDMLRNALLAGLSGITICTGTTLQLFCETTLYWKLLCSKVLLVFQLLNLFCDT